MALNTAVSNNFTELFNYSKRNLEELNNSRACALIPAMVVLAILMLIGIAGNTLVCYVFCCKLRSGTQNFLIVCLAAFDMLSCTIAIPNEIADMRYYYMFESEVACKIMRFVNTFTAIGSILTLLVIAIDRFRKVCRPFQGQLSMAHVRLLLIPIIGGALFFGWPAFIMYGLRTIDTEIPGIIGKDCSTPNTVGETIFPLLYNLVLFTCFVIVAMTLIILYSFVLRETKRHNKYMKRTSDYSLPSSSHYNSEDSKYNVDFGPGSPNVSFTSNAIIHTNEAFDLRSVPEELSASRQSGLHSDSLKPANKGLSSLRKLSVGVSTTGQRINVKEESTDSNSPFTITKEEVTTFSHMRNAAYTTKRTSVAFADSNLSDDLQASFSHDSNDSFSNRSLKLTRKYFKSKTTIIAFWVTLVFILSFLPHLSLQIAKLIHKGFDYNLEGVSFVLYNIFLRSYFINSVSNPVIYGALNKQFSVEVKRLVKRLRSKAGT